MRVLHVHQRAGFFGGVEQILHDSAAGLSRRGWPQALLYADPETDPGFLSAFSEASNSESVIARFRPDIALVHKSEDPARFAAVIDATPAVRMVHDHDLVCLRRHKYFPLSGQICEHAAGLACYRHLCCVQRPSKPGSPPIVLRGLRAQRRIMAANRNMRRFIVGSRWMRGQLQKNNYPGDSIDVIHPVPRDLDAVHLLPTSSAPEILYVGQVIRGKGVDLLLRALSRVHNPWRATIVGVGNHLDYCRALAEKLSIGDRVQFPGWVPHDELEAYYANARFSVVPSRWPEPFGMVGLEAMSRGRPVVGFAAGGIPDWLADGVAGLLVPAGDVEGFARAMDRLLEDQNLAASLGRGAAKLAAEKFSHRSYLDNLMRSLESAA